METDDGETRIDKVMKKLNWNMKGIKMRITGNG
jgi:lipopolysaccharide export system permease protein